MNVFLRLMEAAVKFVWWWGPSGVHSHFHVQPNYSVEVVLRCVVLLTITFQCYSIACFFMVLLFYGEKSYCFTGMMSFEIFPNRKILKVPK